MGKYSQIGIDISAAGVKVAQLKRLADRWTPAALVRQDWVGAEGASHDHDIVLTKTVQSALKQHRCVGRRAVITAPPAIVEIRPITVPISEGLDLMSYVRSELAERHAENAGNLVADYWIAGEVVEYGGAKLELYSVAAPRERIIALIKGVERAGLICTRVEIAATALAHTVNNCITPPDPQNPQSTHGPTVFLDIGEANSQLLALTDDGITFCRQLAWGGRTATRQIKDALDIDMETAERLKTEWGMMPIADQSQQPTGQGASAAEPHPRQQRINDSIEQSLRTLALEIARSLAYRARSNAEGETRDVVLLGGGSRLKGLDRFVADALKLKVHEIADLCDPMWRSDNNDKTTPLLTFEVAVGAALAGMN